MKTFHAHHRPHHSHPDIRAAMTPNSHVKRTQIILRPREGNVEIVSTIPLYHTSVCQCVPIFQIIAVSKCSPYSVRVQRPIV